MFIRKKLPLDSELRLYGLSREDLNFFISTFVQSRFPYNIKLDEDSDWMMTIFYGKRTILNDYAIAKHLMGKHWVATFPGYYTKYLCLDLDYSTDQKETLDAILRIFPNSLLIQSSMSRGIHVYFFLDSKIAVNKLQQLINKRLNNHGIEVRPGHCEIFPQKNRALRLPLGKGSYVLNEETLIPLHQKVKDGTRLIEEKITYHSITEILPQSTEDGNLNRSVSAPNEANRNIVTVLNGIEDSVTPSNLGILNPPWDKLRGEEFKAFILHSLRSGIEIPGTRYSVQSKLIYYCWSMGDSKERCYDSISRWYLSRNHKSKDWEKNPDRVLRQLRSAIDSLYRNAELKGYQPRARTRKLLTREDARYISRLTRDYREQKFIFSLMQYALNAKDSKGEFRLPRIVITTFDCCSDKSYQQKIHLCESIGLIRKVREYHRQEKRARTYLINYSFSEGGEPAKNLEQGLKAIFDLKHLRLRYSRWVYSKILKEG